MKRNAADGLFTTMSLRIFHKEVPLISLLFIFGETILICTAVASAAFVRFGSIQASFLSSEVLIKSLLVTVICQVTSYYNELYDLKIVNSYFELSLRLTKALGITCILLALFYYFIPSLMIGPGVFFISLVFLVLFIVPWRFAYNWILKKKMLTEKIILLGTGDLARQIINEIKSTPDSAYDISGIVTQGSSSRLNFTHDIPFFNNNGDLCDLTWKLGAKKIVVAMDEKRGKLPTKELLTCKMDGIKVLQGETLYEELTGKLFIERLNPSWLIFSEGFGKSPGTQLLKRLSDFILATIGLLLALPVICLTALAIKLDSKGPVLYRQKRCGEGCKTFEMLKFRSMVEDAEDNSGPQWASDHDQRITGVGRILRRYRLDELPQTWNVFKGNMSFVGPRPERPEFIEQLAQKIPYYSQRHTIKPGITGWAQVSYRYSASIEDTFEKLKYDLFYVKNMSMPLDLLILLKTIKIVLLNKGSR